MFKKTITYTNYNDVEVTEDFYFNLTKSEIMEMQLSTTGGLAEMIQKIVDAQDTPGIIKIFKEIILRSYGEKSPDGKYFHKSPELSENFSHTEAYSQLFMELSTDDKKAAAFINGVIPSELAQQANASSVVPMPPTNK